MVQIDQKSGGPPMRMIFVDEVERFTEREYTILHGYVLPQPQPEVLYRCSCGNLELYFPGAKRLPCSNECGGIMIQMEPFPSFHLLPPPRKPPVYASRR